MEARRLYRLAGAPAVGQPLIVSRPPEKGNMLRHLRPTLLLFLVLAAVPLAAVPVFLAGLAAKQSAAGPASGASSETGLDLSAINRAVDPCTDFFQFACGAWLAGNPLPPDRPRWGRFDELQERNYEMLRRVLETAASGGEAATKKIGDYYAACMNSALSERRGAAPLEEDLRAIRSAQPPGGSARAPRRPSPNRRRRILHIWRRSRFPGREDRDRRRRPGRTRPPGSRLLLPRRCAVGRHSRPVRGARRGDRPAAWRHRFAARRSGADGGAGRGTRWRKGRSTTCRGGIRRRSTIASRQASSRPSPRPSTGRATSARAGAPPLQAINVTEPDFFKAFDQLLAGNARWTTSRPIFGGNWSTPTRRFCRRRSSTKTSASTGKRCGARPSCRRDGGDACSTPTRTSANRSARRSSRRPSAPLRRPTCSRWSATSSRRWNATSRRCRG